MDAPHGSDIQNVNDNQGNTESDSLIQKNEAKNPKKIYILIVGVVFAILLLGKPIFYTLEHEPYTTHFLNCTSNSSNLHLDQEYQFTFGVSLLLFFFRFVESLTIFFLSGTCTNDYYKIVYELKSNIHFKFIPKRVSVILALLGVLIIVNSLIVPSLGFTLVWTNRSRAIHTEDCFRLNMLYSIFWILDVFRYVYDIGVRILLILATICIFNIWSEKFPKLDKCENEPDNYDLHIEHMNRTFNNYQKLEHDYQSKGYSVQLITRIFTYWFIFPWVVFFIGLNLSANSILEIWNTDGHDYRLRNFPQVSFLIYNINQMNLLFVQYLCCHMINEAHRKYFKKLEEYSTDYKTASQSAFSALYKVDKNDDYDFASLMPFSKISVSMGAPLYPLLLLFGLFFIVTNTLLI